MARGGGEGVSGGKDVDASESDRPSAIDVPPPSTTQGDCSPIVNGNNGEVNIESNCE